MCSDHWLTLSLATVSNTQGQDHLDMWGKTIYLPNLDVSYIVANFAGEGIVFESYVET